MMRLLLFFVASLPFLLSANQIPSSTFEELPEDWTTFEIGLVLEGDHGDNSRISGSCLRFLKIKNSPKVFYEVLHYRPSNLNNGWSCRETKNSELIDFKKMKEIIENFDQLKTKEKAEWSALSKSKITQSYREKMKKNQTFHSYLCYRIEKDTGISQYGGYAGIYFQKYAMLGTQMIEELGKK